MKQCIVNIACGQKYQPLAARLVRSLVDVADNVPVLQWLNTYPPGSPKGLELPYAAYCAKPFAFIEAQRQGYDVVLWLDAACYAVRHTVDFFGQIEADEAYFQANGWRAGEWMSDKSLVTLGVTRDEAMVIPECSTMAVGLDLRVPRCQEFLKEWARLAADGVTFPGAHTNDIGGAAGRGVAYREVGHVSDDPRVMGHRHDQSAASVLAFRLGFSLTPRPIFVDYENPGWQQPWTLDLRTVILNRG